MLKLISDKDVNFFRKKTISAPKVETIRMARYIQILGMTTYELRLATDCPHNNGVFRTMIFFN